jgi:protein disulfide-isomerase
LLLARRESAGLGLYRSDRCGRRLVQLVADRIALPETVTVKNKRLVVLLAAALGLVVANCARAESSWETDFKKAQQEAKANKKLLFIDFTGSDWCGYCIRLDRDILSKQQFKDYASKNLVLLEIDFPRRKEQTSAVKAQNEKLAQEYQIEGFPTLVVLDGDGHKVWRYDGFFPNGAEAFIAELEKLRKS